MEQLEAKQQRAQEAFTQSRAMMLYAFKLLLRTGNVIARGVKLPYNPGAGPTEIAPSDWALLDFDVNDTGFETAQADDIIYKGLEFRKT